MLEAHTLATAVVGFDNHAADNVGGHEVGRELDAAIFQVEHAGQRAEQSGLAQPGDALQEDVPAGEQADHHAIHHIGLADDDFADFTSDQVQLGYSVSKSGIN